MFIVHASDTVTFTITRPKEASPESITGGTPGDPGVAFVRAVDPVGDVTSIGLTGVVAPTSTTEGSIAFSDVLSVKGVYRYEIINDAGDVTHVLHVNAVERSTAYTSTVKF